MNSDAQIGRHLRVGGIDAIVPALLAPMSGITDVAFRRIAARFGAGLVVTEMVGSDSLVRQRAEARLRSEGEGISPHVVQLVGRDPATMGEAARIAEAGGADIVDINFGCPAKRVTGGLAGSALMREEARALSIVAAVRAATTCPVTVKMRLGWDDARRNAPVLSRRAADLGIDAVTVHGRTRQQFYTGHADWSAIAEVVSAVGVPVIANGDILCLADARTCLARSGAAGVMIGRAALGQPWIVGGIGAALAGRTWTSPGGLERSEAAIAHFEALLGLYGERVGLRHARKHLAAYADVAAGEGFGLDPASRRALVTTLDPREVVGHLGRLYAQPMRIAA